MTVTARVATGVKALYVLITGGHRTVTAMITREALERCWDVGPEQDDLLRAFAAHKDEIAAAVRHLSKTARGDLFLVKDLAGAVARPRQRSARPVKLGEQASMPERSETESDSDHSAEV